MTRTSVNRREFLAASGTAAAAVSAMPKLSTAAVNVAGASGRLRIGFIGIGGRGFRAHVRKLAALKTDGANIELVAAADVYSVYRDKFEHYVKKHNGNTPETYVDYRDSRLKREKVEDQARMSPRRQRKPGTMSSPSSFLSSPSWRTSVSER